MIKKYSFLVFPIIALFSSTAVAQILGTSAYIYGDYVEIGINDAGHEGAPRVPLSNNRSNQALGSPVYFGFVANPQMDAWGNYDGDFFTPGSPENGFGLEIGGVNYSNNASGTLEQIPGSISSYDTNGDCIYVEWDGSVANVDVHIVYRLITTELYYTTEVTLTNTGPTDIFDTYYYRNLDPDNNVTIGGGYATQNTIVAQPTPDCEKALVTAEQTGPWDSYIGLGAIGEAFRVSYGGFANRDASNIWNAAGGLTGGVGMTTFSDQAISLGYLADTLAVGVPETFLFTVVLDASQIDAAISSLYYFDYLGGGGVIDECAPVVDTAYICQGDSVAITVDGPSADDYIWSWDPPIGLGATDGPTVMASPDVTTAYTVTGVPAPACLAAAIEKTIIVDVTAAPIIEIIDPGPQCGDFDLTTLEINNLGEGDPVVIEFYSVVPDSMDQVVGIWPTDLIGFGDTVYVMMGDPVLGCMDVEPIIIDFDGGANAGEDNVAVLCNDEGSSIDLNSLLSLDAELGGIWSEISPILSGGFDDLTGVLDASGVDAGDYTFEYIALGIDPCEDDTAMMTITINREALAGLDSTYSLCNTDGTTIDLNDLLDGNNDVGDWLETTASGQFDPVEGIFDASGLGAGDYTFTYTVDALAPCVPDVADFTVTVLPNPIIDAGADFAICDGDEATLAATGAGLGGTYAWDGAVIDGVAFAPDATDTYTVTGTDANGCVNTDDITVTVNPLPLIDAGADFAICDGDAVTLTGAGAGMGGTYLWDGGVTDEAAFTPLATTTYTLTGTDANGCVNTDEITITVNPLPLVDAGPDFAICDGDEAILSGTGAGLGGTYIWDGGVIDGVAFIPAATAAYIVTGTDANGCVNTDEVTVTVNPLPVIYAGLDQEICQEDVATLFGSGAGPDGSYLWTDDVIDGEPFSPVATTTYTVIGTDVNGCVNTDDVTVTVFDLPAVDAGPDQELCLGEEAVLIASGAGIDGAYVWTGGVVDGEAFTPDATDSYTVTGTDVNGCENTDNLVVTVIPLPDIFAGDDQEICEGESAILNGSGAGMGGVYLWSGGVIDGVLFSPIETSTYTVIGTTADGCTSTDEVTVTVNPLPFIAFAGDNLTGCAPLRVSFESYGEGIDFEWEFGDGSVSTGSPVIHTYTSSGLYSVRLKATSAEGCVNFETYEGYVDVVETPIAQFSYAPYDIEVTDTEVDFINNSVYADNYEWSFGDGSSSDADSPSHMYAPKGDRSYNVELTATNDYGCEDVVNQVIYIKDVIIYYIPNTFTPDGDSFNEEFKPQFTSGLDIYDFHMMIFNRWGELVFESYDANFGWDGSFGGMGLVEDGVYIYKIEFGDTMSDKRHYIDGHITVLK